MLVVIITIWEIEIVGISIIQWQIPTTPIPMPMQMPMPMSIYSIKIKIKVEQVAKNSKKVTLTLIIIIKYIHLPIYYNYINNMYNNTVLMSLEKCK